MGGGGLCHTRRCVGMEEGKQLLSCCRISASKYSAVVILVLPDLVGTCTTLCSPENHFQNTSPTCRHLCGKLYCKSHDAQSSCRISASKYSTIVILVLPDLGGDLCTKPTKAGFSELLGTCVGNCTVITVVVMPVDSINRQNVRS